MKTRPITIIALAIALVLTGVAQAAGASPHLRCEALFAPLSAEQTVVRQLANLRLQIDMALAKNDRVLASVLNGEFKRIFLQARADGLDLSELNEYLNRGRNEAVAERTRQEDVIRETMRTERDLLLMERKIVLHGNGVMVQTVQYSPDGARLLSMGTADPILWDTATWKPLTKLTIPKQQVRWVHMSANGNKILVTTKSREAIVFDGVTGAELLKLKIPKGTEPTGFSISADGARVLCQSQATDALIVWDSTRSRPLYQVKAPKGHYSEVGFSADGQRILTANDTGDLQVLDAADGRELFTFQSPNLLPHNISYSPDGATMYSHSFDSWVTARRASDGQQIYKVRASKGELSGFVVSPDALRFAIGFKSGRVAIFDAATGRRLQTLKGHKKSVTALAFNEDGSRLASGSQDGSVALWRVETGDLEQELKIDGNPELVHAFAFKPNRDPEAGEELAIGTQGMNNNIGLSIWGRP